jgi:hypothetical protein
MERANSGSFTLPSRSYVPPEFLTQVKFEPSGLARKILQINSHLAILCAGQRDKAEELAFRAKDWFLSVDSTLENLDNFIAYYYSEHESELQAILVLLAGKGYSVRLIGTIMTYTTPQFGHCLFAGSGGKEFWDHLQYVALNSDETPGHLRERVVGLVTTFLANEIVQGASYFHHFGGCFEVLQATYDGFRRVDDISLIFLYVHIERRDAKIHFEVRIHHHMLRQWYQGNCLYVLSASDEEVSGQGLVSQGYVVADVLTEYCPEPGLGEVPAHPKILCTHQTLLFEGRNYPCTAVYENTDYVEMKQNGDFIKPEFKKPYYDQLWAEIRRITGT